MTFPVADNLAAPRPSDTPDGTVPLREPTTTPSAPAGDDDPLAGAGRVVGHDGEGGDALRRLVPAFYSSY